MMFRISWIATTVVAAALWTGSANSAEAWGRCCVCPPAPIQATLAVAPPCTCCPFDDVTVCVPACCTEAPTVCWRQGLFGRQIGTYSWACCGHTVKVIVTGRGDVRVRD